MNDTQSDDNKVKQTANVVRGDQAGRDIIKDSTFIIQPVGMTTRFIRNSSISERANAAKRI